MLCLAIRGLDPNGHHIGLTLAGGDHAGAVSEVLKLKGRIEIVPPGSLPNDGKVIEDARSYE